ncbi:MAG: DUF3006 domain-containing protein [Anaerolineales bacterium]|jgi:hypothetical protein
MMKAVIDRFEGDLAVLIVGDDDQSLNIPRTQLPPEAEEGFWLQLDIVGGQLINITLDEEETKAARQRIADKLARSKALLFLADVLDTLSTLARLVHEATLASLVT